MKIRTDFVTNSSSVSQAEIVIDNIVLLDILLRYKEMGMFGNANTYFSIGNYNTDIDMNTSYASEIKTPAFHYYEDLYGEGSSAIRKTPESLHEVLSAIIDIMDNGINSPTNYDRILFAQMKQELLEMNEEIKASYFKVVWSHRDETELWEGVDYKWSFIYDLDNGENYNVEFVDFKGNKEYIKDGKSNVIIPEHVEVISENAFIYRTDIESVQIHSGVTRIGDCAFSHCIRLNQIKIPDSVTRIGDNAFDKCISLTAIEIPKDVTSIGECAFYGCNSLISIVIPKGVPEIGYESFAECESLNSIVIPESVNEIGGGAFRNCSSLNSIVIPKGVQRIRKFTFYGCFNLTSIVIPESVIEIGEGAFFGCKNLTSVVIRENGKLLEANAFSRYNNIVSVPLSREGTNIGRESFSGCEMLNYLIIPNNISRLGANAFFGCEQAQISIVYHHNTKLIPEIEGLNFIYVNLLDQDKIVIGKLYNLGIKQDEPYTKFMAQLLSGGVEHLSAYDSLFSACNKSVIKKGRAALSRLQYPLELNQEYKDMYITYLQDSEDSIIPTIIKENNIAFLKILAEIGAIQKKNIFFYIDQADELELDDLKTILSDYKSKLQNQEPSGKKNKFDENNLNVWHTIENNDGSLTINKYLGDDVHVTIPSEINNKPVKRIDGWHVNDEVKLSVFVLNRDMVKSVTIKDGIEVIGQRAFLECRNMTSIQIPASVVEISEQALAGCKSITSINIQKNVTHIGTQAFSQCNNLASIVIPESVTHIGDYAFEGCIRLTLPIILDNEIEVGFRAFDVYHNLASVVLPDGITEIEDNAFDGNHILSSIVIPEGVTIIGFAAFEDCIQLKLIVIPKSLIRIESFAFSECKNLTSIDIAEKVTYIGDYAFEGCVELKTILLPESLNEIGEAAFDGCDKLVIHAPEGSYAIEYAKQNNIKFFEE